MADPAACLHRPSLAGQSLKLALQQRRSGPVPSTSYRQQRGRVVATASTAIWGAEATPSSEDMFALGYVDCEAPSCGYVPDGAIVLIPFSEQPKKREERVSVLEKGVCLAEEETTLIGAVPTGQVKLVVNDAEVSAKHARIEGLVNDKEPAWWMFGRPQRQITYYLTDLGSLNGTYLNRSKIRPLLPVKIMPGDVVAFGNLNNSYRVVQAWGRH